ncbi:MAG TPA: hypothetical protein VGG78_01345 [Gemmatimonadaceae bacterium]
MTRRSLVLLLCAPLALHAQDVVVRGDDSRAGAAALQRALATPHVVRAGSGRLDLPRDSTVATSLVVLGRPTYLAGRVDGDVVVVGADLFLRPGANVAGRAIAIGGTVSTSALGTVANGVQSVRDEEVSIERDGSSYVVTLRDTQDAAHTPLVQPAGIYGLRLPTYDRVDGLSLPVGAVVTVADSVVVIEPTATYRSRLGTVDPSATIGVLVGRPVGFVARVARETRTNDAWIYSNLVNSLFAFFTGADTRNYFRSDIAEGRLVGQWSAPSDTVEAYAGGRHERVHAITAAGDVWSVTGRKSPFKIQRPNPLVEEGDLGSAIVGADMRLAHGPVTASFAADAEQGFSTPVGTSHFLQLTLDGRVQFPTFGTQALHVHAHGVATHGDSVPLARFAYLGGSGTLRTLDLLEQGGTALFYLENRYVIPIDAVHLPLIGNPVLTLRDAFGSAGIGSLPAFQHEIGAGIGVSAVRLEFATAVAGRRGTELGLGISFRR